MLALGVVGLTTYRRSQLKETHDQIWREMKRTQHRLHVSAKQIVFDEGSPQEEENGSDDTPSVQFSLELLCGCLLKDQCDNQMPRLTSTEFVRLNWANRSVLKGRVALLNSRSPYLDQLLKRAVGEELAGFALYGNGEDPLDLVEAAGLLKRVEDATLSAGANPVPVWLIYGSAAQNIAQANAFRIESEEKVPAPDEQYFLPGSEEGVYSIAWLPESVAVSSAQIATKVTGVFDNISVPYGGWNWGWSSPCSSEKIVEIDHANENYLAARMLHAN
eukprot:gnl/MRDRNA2_/MRDRNA2_139246_c0_seq1.p1 gnl/MRDRNA2_/MRDRNA2_139246_c0~~gnl/MRDRNA2_/MRDRNA2_139246_c0_seq1.p1  ORF type:complete len:275 (-),score=47.66 gnl/MRDRNA2_/MRDRNA2_139246_c0_seq1:49-873(-)